MERLSVILVATLAGACIGAIAFFMQPFTGWIALAVGAGAALGALVGALVALRKPDDFRYRAP